MVFVSIAGHLLGPARLLGCVHVLIHVLASVMCGILCQQLVRP
jgi:hypothetical protein